MSTNQKQFLPVKLAGGESSSVILQKVGDKKFVLKHSVRNDLKREQIALKIAKKSGVAVTDVLSYKNGNLELEFINGRNIEKSDLSDLFFKNLGIILQKLHTIKVSKVGELISPKQYSEKNWFNFLKAKLNIGINDLVRYRKIDKTEAKNFLDCWIVQFRKLQKRSFQPTLLHNDVHLDNILITKNGKLYLIDFEDSFFGDPLYDLIAFSDFHPRLFPKLKKYYNNKAVLSNDWQEWFKVYEFIHWVNLCSFYVDIGKQKNYNRYLSKILNFCRQRKTCHRILRDPAI